MKKYTGKIIGWLVVVMLILLVALAIISLPQIPKDLNALSPKNPTQIFADNGQVIKVLANKQIVPIENVPDYFLNAVVSLEDTKFYQHHGFSKQGFTRALLTNLKAGRVKQGGSTITQQLVKNLFYDFDKSWMRKIHEVFVAFQIEQQFTKNQILEAYINQIDFGSGIYGIEMAAQIYFAKHPDELTLAEAAMLAGIPRSPYRYNPYYDEQIAKDRQTFVLKRMNAEGFISNEEMTTALEEELHFSRMEQLHGHAGYFVSKILQTTKEKYSDNTVNHGGLQIYSTINPWIQLAASQAVEQGLKNVDEMLGLAEYDSAKWDEKLQYPQAALIALDPHDGAIKAIVGGRDFRRAPFNRVFSNNRSPGSSFKLFTFLAALDKGVITPKTILIDEPVKFELYNSVWEPQNFEKEFAGPMVAKWAFLKSVNTVAAQIIDRVKPETVVDYAQKMGIKSELQPHYALALGATGVSPLEMAASYSTIVNGGVYKEPFFLSKITTANGQLIEQNKIDAKRVCDSQTSFLMLDFMRGVILRGTGRTVRNYGFTLPSAGKTGTTNDNRDAWFVGFTPHLVCAVWVGFDDNREMIDKYNRGLTGGRAALPIWAMFMKKAHERMPYQDFKTPPGIYYENIDPRTAGQPSFGENKLSVALRISN